MSEQGLIDDAGLVGEVLNQSYLIEERIGKGGMAWVYRGVHTRLQEHVAIKVLFRELAGEERVRERFLREARFQAKVKHPHVVAVSDFIEERGIVGIVQEWIDGGDLKQWMEVNPPPLPADVIGKILLPVISAMGEAHSNGVIHRDLKPGNILLQSQRGLLTPKVSDFGVAKLVDQSAITQTGQVIGTPLFMSPEQLSDAKLVDHRSDIYSFGVILYYMVSGMYPFAGNIHTMMYKLFHEAVTYPEHISSSIRGILERSLAKDPNDRYESCLQLESDLLSALHEPGGIYTMDPPPRPISSPDGGSSIFASSSFSTGGSFGSQSFSDSGVPRSLNLPTPNSLHAQPSVGLPVREDLYGSVESSPRKKRTWLTKGKRWKVHFFLILVVGIGGYLGWPSIQKYMGQVYDIAKEKVFPRQQVAKKEGDKPLPLHSPKVRGASSNERRLPPPKKKTLTQVAGPNEQVVSRPVGLSTNTPKPQTKQTDVAVVKRRPALPHHIQLVEKMIRAMGGRKAWDNLKSLTITGLSTITQLSANKPVKLTIYELYRSYSPRGISLRMDLRLPAGKFSQLFTPGGGWVSKGHLRVPVSEDALKYYYESQQHRRLEFRYKIEGIQVTQGPNAVVNGRSCESVLFTDRAGRQTTYFIDRATYLLLKRSYKQAPYHNVHTQYFGDYRWVPLKGTKLRIRTHFQQDVWKNGYRLSQQRYKTIVANDPNFNKVGMKAED